MKKLKYVFLVCCLSFLLTGCVKYNATMEINKDKSMEFSIIYALDTSVFGKQKSLDSDGIKKLEDAGFTVEEYSKDGMEGFTISKKIKNIDDVSTTDDVKYSLSDIGEKDSDKMMFKVKKGSSKNKYTANFVFDSNDSGLNSGNSSTQYKDSETDTKDDDNLLVDTKDDDLLVDTDDSKDDDDTDLDLDLDTDSNSDYSKYMANMDMSFTVKLPYAALSNNATKVSDDGKTLTWSLVTDKASNIEFEFELDNGGSGDMVKIILIVCGCVLGLVFICLLIGFIATRGNKNKYNNYPPMSSATSINNTNNDVKVEDTKPEEAVREETVEEVPEEVKEEEENKE